MTFFAIDSSYKPEAMGHQDWHNALMYRWNSVMMTGGDDCRGYHVKENEILYVCDARRKVHRTKEYLFQFREVTSMYYENETYLPDHPKHRRATIDEDSDDHEEL